VNLADAREDVERAISAGRTLPAWFYTSEGILELEERHLFERSWQVFGTDEQLAEPGDFTTGAVGRIPIVLVRDREGVLRGFVNVCRHRGHVVAEGCGNRTTFQCPYHAWTYGLDGRLRAAPRSDSQAGFDREDHPLLSVQVAQWGPIVFVNVDPDAPPFEERFAELLATGRENGLTLDGTRLRLAHEWDWACNWKVFYDNAGECYHCATVHPSFTDTYLVGEDDYRLDYHDSFVRHRSPVRPDRPPGAALRDWEMLSAWPNWTLGAGEYEGSVLVWTFEPRGPSRMRLRTWYCGGDGVSDDQMAEQADWWRSIVDVEDRAVCEGVQRGLASGAVKDGPLLLKSEHVIQHFQEQLLSAWR
jgi:phenylpropionate dioxygenase-like ring-hydroxylating dioxygenase large terminal subunit